MAGQRGVCLLVCSVYVHDLYGIACMTLQLSMPWIRRLVLESCTLISVPHLMPQNANSLTPCAAFMRGKVAAAGVKTSHEMGACTLKGG